MKRISRSDRKLDFDIHALVFVVSMLGWGSGLLIHWWFARGPGAGRDEIN